MENNMENNNTAEQQEKTFTQEEVNRIIQERLARVKNKDSGTDPGEAEQGNELEERETSVTLRESRVECREFVAEKGYNKELLEILDTSDPEKFKSQVERLVELNGSQEKKKIYPGTKENPFSTEQHKRSFGDSKHIPKKY